MARKHGYYWAKHPTLGVEEVVEVGGDGRVWRTAINEHYSIESFDWISDTPIQVEKMPVKLVHQHYYVVRKVFGEFVAMWNENIQKFVGMAQEHSRDAIQIVSGPFSIEQLTKLKPE